VGLEYEERNSTNRLAYRQGTEGEHDCNIDEQEKSFAVGIDPPFLPEEKKATSR